MPELPVLVLQKCPSFTCQSSWSPLVDKRAFAFMPPICPYHRIQFPLQFTSLTGTTYEITPTRQKSHADPSLGSCRSRFRAQNALNALKRRARPRLQNYRLPPSSGPVGLGSHSPLCFQAAGKGRGSRPNCASAAGCPGW